MSHWSLGSGSVPGNSWGEGLVWGTVQKVRAATQHSPGRLPDVQAELQAGTMRSSLGEGKWILTKSH